MTIHDRDAYMRGIWDWKILDGCFGNTKIAPTDIDGLVERNGNLLILETKAPGASVPEGQSITFRRIVQQGVDAGKLNVVIVIWGENGTPTKLRVYSAMHPEGKNFDDNLETLRKYVAAWFQRANKQQWTGSEAILEGTGAETWST